MAKENFHSLGPEKQVLTFYDRHHVLVINGSLEEKQEFKRPHVLTTSVLKNGRTCARMTKRQPSKVGTSKDQKEKQKDFK